MTRHPSKVKVDIEIAEREYDLNKAAELKYAQLPALTAELEAEEAAEAEAAGSGETLLRDTVTPEDIAGVVSSWTGIPLEKLAAGELDKVRCYAKSASI